MAHNVDILCIGKATLDQFLVINNHAMHFRLDPRTGFLSFKHGEKIGVEKVEFCLGGNASNVAVGLSRLGFSSALCTEIGDDEFSITIRKALSKEHIDLSSMIVTENARSPFSVIINYRGERTIFMQRSERVHNFNFDHISAKYIFLTSLEKEWQKPYKQALSYLVKNGGILAFNPGTIQLHEGKELVTQIIEHASILFVNKEEAEELVLGHEKRRRINDTKYVRELLVKLQKMGAKTAVITNGRYGSHAIDEYGNFYHEGVFPAVILERTGAGDAYATGFLGAIMYQKSIKEAMKWGAINSASVVESIGAEAGLLTLEELERREHGTQTTHIIERPKYHPFLQFAFEKLGLK